VEIDAGARLDDLGPAGEPERVAQILLGLRARPEVLETRRDLDDALPAATASPAGSRYLQRELVGVVEQGAQRARR
jgi:hypothetical protein